MNEGEMALFSKHVRPGSVNMRSFAYLRDKESGKLRDIPEELKAEPLQEDDTATTTQDQHQEQQ